MNEATQGPLWRAGEVIDGRYEVIRLAGEGGMGWVYQVRHLEWGIDLAVKQPKPKSLAGFEQEAEAWVKLGLHPNLCCCHYVRHLDGLPMVFAEYVPGGSLHNWIEDRRLYEGPDADVLRRILDVAIQFAWGLEHAHQRAMVHQDVKPHNVLIDTPGGDISVKVTDFGLARAHAGTGLASPVPGADAGEAASIMVSRAGWTWAYASPERIGRSPGQRVVLSQRTDVYSYAVSVLEIFVGKRLWQTGDEAGQELSAYLARGAAAPGMPQMPAALGALLQRCLHEKPEGRPRSMASIAAEIVAIYQSAVHSAYPRAMPRTADLLADELNNRGLSLLDLGRIAEAEEAFKAAQDADPRHLEATYNDGLRQWRSGAITDDALISNLDAARTASGDSWLARYLLAEVHLERGDLTAAQDLLRTVEHMAPNQPKVANALQTVRSGRLTDARCVKALTMNWWPEYERWVTEADGRKAKYASRTKIRFTADGQRALVASMKHVGLWDINSGHCLFRQDEPHYYKEIDISADGRFALWSLDNEVQMRDLTRGRELWRVGTHEDSPDGTRYIGMPDPASAPVEIVRLSADARTAATQSGGGNVTIWDARTGGLRLQLGRHGKLYMLSSDGRFALIRRNSDTIQLRDTTTGACRWELHGVNGAMPAVISLDSRTVAMARSRETGAGTWENIGIWDLTTGREIRTLTGHPSRVWSLSWSSDGRRLLSGGSDGTARLWELDSGRCLRTFPSTASVKQEVLLQPDSGRALAADEDMVRWFTLPSRYTAPPQLSRPRHHGELTRLDADVTALVDAAEQAITARRFTEAHELLTRARATRGYERAPHVLTAWRSLADVLPRAAGVRASWQVGEFPGLSISPSAVDLSPDGARIVSGGETLCVWDTNTGRCLREWDTSTRRSARMNHDRLSPLTAVRISPDQRRVLSATQDGQICLWSIDTGECMMKITNQQTGGTAQPAHFSADGRWALVCDWDKAIHLWDMDSGRCARTVPGHGPNGFITTDLWLSPDGRRAVSGSWDRTVRVWDMGTGECMHVLASDTEITSVSLSPDGGFVLASGHDRTIRLWDLGSGACVHVQRDLPNNAHTVRYVCNGRFVMAVVPGRATSLIQVWDPRTGRFLHSLDTRQLGLAASAFTPDGRFAVTGGLGTPLRLWELDWELDTAA